MAHHLTSHITVRVFQTGDPVVGKHDDSRKPRTTEINALLRIAFGDEIAATDTIGEARRAGKVRCARCCQYKDRVDYSAWTKPETGVTYLKTYCKRCVAEMTRSKRFSQADSLQVYPRRVE